LRDTQRKHGFDFQFGISTSPITIAHHAQKSAADNHEEQVEILSREPKVFVHGNFERVSEREEMMHGEQRRWEREKEREREIEREEEEEEEEEEENVPWATNSDEHGTEASPRTVYIREIKTITL
jgi:hypothetical protein